MKNTMVVVADLGCLKAYRLTKSPHQKSANLQLVDQFDNDGANQKLKDNVSDAAGRFSKGGARSVSGMSRGERHNIDLEKRKRMVRNLADHLTLLLRQEQVEDCYLAASREIYSQLWNGLEPDVQSLIAREVHADLTKVDRSQLLGYF